MILCIETATPVCSVALCDRAGIVALNESSEERSHATQLTVLINNLLASEGININSLEAVAVSKGPGSYTGLRIGVSVAKGIAYGASVPLIGIETTRSMFYGLKKDFDDQYGAVTDTIFCPMLDARRMEVYYCLYNNNGRIIRDISAEVIYRDSFKDIPGPVRLVFFGTGAAKCKTVVEHDNSIFIDNFNVSASFMLLPAYEAVDKNKFEDVAYFEPFYLKDFIATIPKKNIIG